MKKEKDEDKDKINIIYGTGNADKMEALKKIIKNLNLDSKIEIESLKRIGFDEEIIEDGKTFEENSLIKAKAIKKYCDKNNVSGKIIITDDAGLCVDMLNGEPGVYTARYAGNNATQEETLNKLLRNMEMEKDINKRTATFVCVLTAMLENGETIVARGECRGKIDIEYRTLGGLTYSPVFIPEGFEKPMREMNEDEYAESHNHREKAMRILIEEFKKRSLF